MSRLVRIGACMVAVIAFAGRSRAATVEQEKAFIDSYRQAYEAQNADALQALLNTDGADPMALEFYGQMMAADFGGTISEISLRDLTPDEVKQAAQTMDGPAGGKFILVPRPYKKLVVKIHVKVANGESTSSDESFVAEKDGKLVIATPAPAPAQ